jgi:hypothetical protein
LTLVKDGVSKWSYQAGSKVSTAFAAGGYAMLLQADGEVVLLKEKVADEGEKVMERISVPAHLNVRAFCLALSVISSCRPLRF